MTSGSSCSFSVGNTNTSQYHYGILFGGTKAKPYLAHVFIGDSAASYEVSITAILPTSNPQAISGVYSPSGTITFTNDGSGSLFGGLRYIDLS